MSFHFADAVLSDDQGPSVYSGDTGFTPVDYSTSSVYGQTQVYPTPSGAPPEGTATTPLGSQPVTQGGGNTIWGAVAPPPPPPPSQQAGTSSPPLISVQQGQQSAGFFTDLTNAFAKASAPLTFQKPAAAQSSGVSPWVYVAVAGGGVAVLAFALTRRRSSVGRYHRRKRR